MTQVGLTRLLDGIDGRSSALVVPDGRTMSHGEVREIARGIAGKLRAAGVRRDDTVALLLPQGVELAIAILGASEAAGAAPLSTALHPLELASSIDRLQPAAIVTIESPAESLSIPAGVVHITIASDDPARWRADGDELPLAPVDPPDDEDTALVLQTSGTTGVPKRVNLTHRNLVTSARNIGSWFGLGDDDRSLTVMPLFHIHGVVAGLLAPLAAGGSIILPRGFDPLRFFRWMEHSRPTWYTAVPAIHRMILARAPGTAPGKLRFVRSSSAPLDRSSMDGLEETFHSPAIETLGTTETSHQIAANPLPPGTRKPGSVGLPSGAELRVVDDTGDPMAIGVAGEVAVRGPGVFGGYADGSGIVDGWFRTGDAGSFDEDGYLFLKGRIKEIINRGGEKISPAEVENALLAHPDVAEAAAFAVADRWLGEEVAVAVVLTRGGLASEADLLRFSRTRLSPSKVPRTVVITESILRGSTGKIRRRDLAAHLGLDPPR